MFEKNKTKQNRQAKDKRGSKKTLATLQADYQAQIRKYLLHLFDNRTCREQLAYWSLMVEGKPGSISQIRLACFETPVLQLQHQQRGNGSRLLLPNVKRNRAKRDGQITGRQKGVSESNRTLSQTN